MKGLFYASGTGPGLAEVHVDNRSYEAWEVVRDFEDVETARAFLQAVNEHGLDAVLTSDWPLDQFGRGDIALRVPPGQWSDAEEFFSGLEYE